jgi:hypothetical protein
MTTTDRRLGFVSLTAMARRAVFTHADWQYVAGLVADQLRRRLPEPVSRAARADRDRPHP